MSKATYPLKLPVSIKRAAERLAKQDGVSLNQWIASAVAEKVGVMETAQKFFAARGASGSAASLLTMLRKAPDREPAPEDRLPRSRGTR
ncbi:MAG: pilus assembly protein HicB [Micropepsaceae bacterium]